MPQEAVGFVYSRTAFKPWSFLQQDGKGWNKILNEKKIFLASTSKHFYPDVLFTHLVAQQGQETPFIVEKAHLCMLPLPKAVGGWGHARQRCRLFQGEATSVCRMQWTLNASAHDSALFLLLTCQRCIQIHLPLGLVYTPYGHLLFYSWEIEKNHIWFFVCPDQRSFGTCLGVSCTLA